MENEYDVICQVTKIGMVMNTKWSVFIDNKLVGKIDFKNDLRVKVSNGKHKVQYKVGLQKTKELTINVENEDVIVECIFDGTVNNFHIVGGNDTTSNNVEIKENISNETVSKELPKNESNVKEESYKTKETNKNNNVNEVKNINTSNTVKTKSNSGCVVAFIIFGIIIFFIVKGIVGLTSYVSDSEGRELAKQYIQDRGATSYYTIFDNTYVIGNIKSYDSSTIIEQKENKYLFKVQITYNPKLNSGSTDITKENQAITYVVYNKESKKFNCYSSLESAKSSEIWTN